MQCTINYNWHHKGATRKKLYQELGLESLQDQKRCCFRKLYFLKLMKHQTPSYFFIWFHHHPIGGTWGKNLFKAFQKFLPLSNNGESVEVISFSPKIRNSLLISNGGITGTFLPLAKVFKIDQYVLALVLGLTNFAANLLWYSVLVSRIKFETSVVGFSRRT